NGVPAKGQLWQVGHNGGKVWDVCEPADREFFAKKFEDAAKAYPRYKKEFNAAAELIRNNQPACSNSIAIAQPSGTRLIAIA
ncbi:MAG: hypothetical protein R3C68_14340, partial [Myxococcota bacterium]